MNYTTYALAILVFVEGLFSLITGTTIGLNKDRVTMKYEWSAYQKWIRMMGGITTVFSVYLFLLALMRDDVLPMIFPVWTAIAVFVILAILLVLSFFYIRKHRIRYTDDPSYEPADSEYKDED